MSSPTRAKVAAAVTIASLGGLAGVALITNTDADPPTTAVPAASSDSRTEVIRRTIHRTKREKPAPVNATPTAAGALPGPAAAPVSTPASALRVSAPPAAPAPAPRSTTRSSGPQDTYDDQEKYADHEDEYEDEDEFDDDEEHDEYEDEHDEDDD
jgi:hypothetical protein